MNTQSTFSEFKRSLKKNLMLKTAPNGRYDQSVYWSVLFCAAERSTTVEDACLLLSEERAGIPSQDTVMEALKAFSVVELQTAWETVFDEQVAYAKAGSRLPRKVALAIDYNDQPYYGQERGNPWFVGGKSKCGTHWFTRVASASIVTNGVRFTVAMLPFCDELDDATVVKYLVSRAMKHFSLDYVTMDKEFYNSTIMNWLDVSGVKYLISGKAYPKYVKLAEKHGTEDFSMECEIGSYYREKAHTTLLSHYDDGKRFWYATNMSIPPTDGDRMHEARWGIETSYRVIGEDCAWTTSNDISVRLFHRMLSFMLYNLWILVNLLVGTRRIRYLHRGKKMREKTLYTFTHKALVRGFAVSLPDDYG